MALEIEVQEVRRAVLTQVVWHRHERQKWIRLLDDEAETYSVLLNARAQSRAHRTAITSLMHVLDDVRVAARARDLAFSGYLQVFGATA